MRTLICGGQVVSVVEQRIGPAEARAVCRVLGGVEHILVVADVQYGGEVVHIWPQGQMSTRDEVTALRAFLAVTDAELRWHPAVSA